METSLDMDDKKGSVEVLDTARTGESSTNARQDESGVAADANEHGEVHVSNGPHHFKVYKRRFFGLLQLTLLNIIVSWDVSTPDTCCASRVVRANSWAVAHVLGDINDCCRVF